MKILALANQKGGVGKSAIGCQLAFYFASRGVRVLFLDLDHQMNSSRPIVKSGRASVADFVTSQVFEGKAGALPGAGFVVVRGDDVLSTLERQPERHNGYVNALRDFLQSVASQFDLCILDTNPNPDIRYAAALITASYLLSPIELNQEAIDGIGSLLNHRRYGYWKIKKVMNQDLELIGLLPNLVEATPFQRENFAQLIQAYSQLLIPNTNNDGPRFAFIPTRTAIAEAQACGVPLWLLRQPVPEAQRDTIVADQMPVRTSAREAWRIVKPTFDVIAGRMGLTV